ncbi:unnamed protein product [Rhizophagus irregularis]|uniref:Uncharacterized protein n=1 Tax=Rhizophagus irregularis TaxID=588596 RepID=A0A2N1P0S5_9GLOM|nr:hypothetical protein RhiirC2_823343 [Rhizophagus irregularis]CAB5374195.1 unnamed protein product [Rhizophagus irregularis]
MGDEIIPIDEKQDDVDNEIVPHNPRDPHNAHNGKYNNINIIEMSTKNQQIKDGDLLIFNNDKISIYHSAHDKISLMSSHRLSKNVHFPIRNIQLKDTDTKIEFCEVQNNDYLLAFNLPKKDEKQNIVLYNINDINKQPIDALMIFNEKKFILYEYNSESKKAFGLVDGKFSYINLLDLNWHEFFESHKEDDDLVGWNDYLGQTFKYYYNDTLAIPDMENIKSLHSPSESKNMKEIRSLFSDEYENKNIATKDINFNNQNINGE